jgi:hypothetical protein
VKLLPIAGPVVRPALSSSTREAFPHHLYARQPIGRGPRPVIRTDPASVNTRRSVKRRRGRALKRTGLYGTAASAILISLTALGIGMADSPRSLMSRQAYDDSRLQIEEGRRMALANCRLVATPERELCRAQARADERVQRADLEARYLGTVTAASEARVARVKARFDLARLQCTQRFGQERNECLKAARSERAKALADAGPAAI